MATTPGLMRPPKFIGVFPSQFPGFGGDENPVFHHKQAWAKDGEYVKLKDLEEKACEMAFHPPSGPCMSCRYSPVGVSGIDASGNCWLLVRDYAIAGHGGGVGLRWVKFVAEVEGT